MARLTPAKPARKPAPARRLAYPVSDRATLRALLRAIRQGAAR